MSRTSLSIFFMVCAMAGAHSSPGLPPGLQAESAQTAAAGQAQPRSPQAERIIYAHNYVVSNPEGCTVGATAVASGLECAVLHANALVADGFQAQLVLAAETYNVYAPMVLANSTNASSLTVRSAGNDNTIINYAGKTPIDSIFAQSSTGVLSRLSMNGGLRIQANKLAGHCLNFPYLNRARVDDVICLDPAVSGIVFGGNTISASQDTVGQSGRYGTGAGAGFIAAISGGRLASLLPASGVKAVAVTAAGSGYTNPVFSATGGNCIVYPTGSFKTSGAAGNKTITSVSTYISGLCASDDPPFITAKDSTGSGASFRVTMAPPGGHRYSDSTKIEFYGYGAAGAPDRPAAVLPTAVPILSSGAVIGATITNAGSGVASTLFVGVVDLNSTAKYGFDIAATDSSFYDLGANSGSVAGVYVHGNPNAFYHLHPQGIPVGVLVTSKDQSFFGLECDSLSRYCIDTSAMISVHDAVLMWDQNGPYSGSGFLHTSDSGAYGSTVQNALVSEQQAYGGYTVLVDSALGAFPSIPAPNFPLNATNIGDARPSLKTGPTASQWYTPAAFSAVTIPGMKSNAGTTFACFDTKGNLVSSATPCAGS